MDNNLATAAYSIDGRKIKQSLGVVRGNFVRSRSIVGTIGAGIQTLSGGNITLFTELCKKPRWTPIN